MKKSIIALLILLGFCALLYATTDQTVVLTSWLDRRNQEPLIKPVWEYVITASYSATDDGNITRAIPLNGILLKIILVVPSDSAEVEILDNGNNKIFDSADQTTGTHTYTVYEPLTGTIDVVIGPDAAIGGSGGDIVVTLRGI